MTPPFTERTRRILFLVLVAAWLLPGSVARTPWKADEAYTFGVVKHMETTGDWVVPHLGGEPFMQKPPVMFIPAAVSGKLLGGFLGRETAYRLSLIAFQILSLVFLAIAARELIGREKAWIAPVLFMGSLGFVQVMHMLITDNALVTGFAIAFAGLALVLRRPVVGGLLIGTGAGVAFMAKGLIGPGMIGVTLMLLPACFRNWRTKGYFVGLGVAALASLPWVLIWPLILYQRDLELFKQWFLDNNLARFLGPEAVGRPNSLGLDGGRHNFFLEMIWFAWPAVPFAFLALWKRWREIRQNPGLQLNIVGMLVMLLVLTASRNSRTMYGMPLMVPACLLGMYGVELVAARWTPRLTKACAGFFGTAVVVMWVCWMAQFAGLIPARGWTEIHKWLPDYKPVFQFWAFLAALVASAIWVWWTLRQPRQDVRTTPVAWCAGLSLVYLLIMTIFFPVVESNMSYKHLAVESNASYKHFAPMRHWVKEINGQPVISHNLGEPQRAMFDYYCDLTTERLEVKPEATGDWFLTQTEFRSPKGRELRGAPWELVWESLHSRKELFRLYRKPPGVPAQTADR